MACARSASASATVLKPADGTRKAALTTYEVKLQSAMSLTEWPHSAQENNVPLMAGENRIAASLALRAWLSPAVLAAIMSALLFGFAGTPRYWHAWVYLSLFFALSAGITLDLLRRDPALLQRRMKGGPTAEGRPLQRLIMLGASLGFVSLLVVPALDFRHSWSSVPLTGVVVGDVLVAVARVFIGRVYRENTFAAATIEVTAGQRLIDTGPYTVVRHPMYASALLYLIRTPRALGSYWGFRGLVFMLPFLVWRLLDEERLLAQELPGYAAYQARVRYRLIPGLW